MIYLFQAAIPTLGVMIYEIFIKKTKKNPLLYVLLFVTLSVANYFIDSCLHAQEPYVYSCSLTDKQRDKYWKLIHEHYMESYTCAKYADGWADIIPRYFDKVAVKAAIAGVTAGLLTKNMTAAGVAMATEAIREAIEDLKGHWENISINMYAAEYHVEMAEFYQDVLFSDGG